MSDWGDPRLPERFWAKVSPEPNSGCWLWAGSASRGYGTFWVDRGVMRYSHRMTYGALVSAIPDGLVIDHLCRTPLCCNPVHLEPVTAQVNALRGFGPSGNNARKATCPQGHQYIPHPYANRPSRFCVVCHNERVRQSRIANENAGYCRASRSHGPATRGQLCEPCAVKRDIRNARRSLKRDRLDAEGKLGRSGR